MPPLLVYRRAVVNLSAVVSAIKILAVPDYSELLANQKMSKEVEASRELSSGGTHLALKAATP